MLALRDKRPFCPDVKDIENAELKQLAERLNGDSEKETLTNILEWQDRNIRFWWERWPLDISLQILIPISSLLALILSLPFLLLLLYYKFLELFALFIVLIVVSFLVLIFSNTISKIFYLFLSFPFVYLFISLALRIPVLTQNILPYTLFYVGCLGAIALIMVYLFIRYEIFWRGKTLKEKIPKFIEILNNTFRLGLPVEKILEYKLAVCRDYAKLTASLLFNVYADPEVYFIKIPEHVAAGIKIEDKIYVLDQRLPILSLDNWLIKWNKKTGIYKSKLKKDSKGGLTAVTCYKQPIAQRPKTNLAKINTEALTGEIAKIIGIRQSSDKKEPSFKIKLFNYLIYYEDDKIIKYSLIRAIKNRLEGESCGNMNKISKVNITQNGKDLTLAVWL